MYIVNNILGKDVNLRDIRAIVPANSIIDLEKLATPEAINSSVDLRDALRHKWLQLGRHSIVRTNLVSKDPSKTSNISEEKIVSLVRKVLNEEASKDQSNPQKDIHDAVNNMQRSMGDLVHEIRNRINTPYGEKQFSDQQSLVSQEKLAEMSQKSIRNISNKIETNGPQKVKKVQIINTNMNDLAKDL